MAANVHRGGLGFEKFFKRRSHSAERSKESEKSVKNVKRNEEIAAKEEKEGNPSKFGKLFGQKWPEEKNDSIEDPKTSMKEIDETNSQKTNDSKKSTKMKRSGESPAESTPGKNDKREDSEACKEYVIKDDVGQIKLSEMINNSIKEAVLNIVKEGVCPLADSLDIRANDTSKKLPSSGCQETQDKENKPASPKQLSSLLSGANKTFDSHLCQNQYQQTTRNSLRNPCKLNDQQECVTVSQYSREVSPRVNKNRKGMMCTKQKEKSVREESPKMSRQSKGQSSHFRTDNRRMTGNVNIYICSEANENAKDKQKSKNKKDCVDDSESGGSSNVSASTSKLVAALRKKQRKNLDVKSLSCVSEMPESSVKRYRSDGKMDDDDDDVLCPCDENSAEIEFPDTQSNSSRDICEGTKFSDLDFSASDLGSQPCISAASYDTDDFWPCCTQDSSRYDDSSGNRRLDVPNEVSNADKNLGERCSCCNLKKCKNNRSIDVVTYPRNCKNQSENRKSRDKSCRTSRDTQEFTKCLCVVEEEDEDCCNDRKESGEKFTVCGMQSTDEELGNAEKQMNELKKSPSGSGILKREKENVDSPKVEKKKSVRTSEIASSNSQQVIDEKNEPNVEGDIDLKPQSPKSTLLSTLRKSFKRSSDKENQESKAASSKISKQVDRVKNHEIEENQRNSEVSKIGDENLSSVENEKQKNSFFYRSIKKAMDIVKIRKDEDVATVEGDEESRKCSPESQTKSNINDDEKMNSEGNEKDTCDRFCEGIDKEKFTINSGKHEKRSKSRIGTAIASRRSLAATSNESSNVSISSDRVNEPDDPNNSSAIQKTMKTKCSEHELQGCKCGKLSERFECCCKKLGSTKNENYKRCDNCKKITSDANVCRKKLLSPKRETSCSCCPKCGNSLDKCICCSRKSEAIESDHCKCCSGCSRPIPECKCCCSKQETTDQEFCKYCQRSKRLCCCDLKENSRANKTQLKNCRKPRDFQENLCKCGNSRSPKCECTCGQSSSNVKCPKSMICIYCDKPKDSCICKAPVRKCSQCGLPSDVCNCQSLPCCDCSGRQIVNAECNNETTISVTAWKPRRNIRRYFAREENHPDGNSESDCPCYEKSKPYGSESLPYQKGTVFSDVMSELQQKMSDSMCCNACRNIPCNCCSTETQNQIEIKPKQRLSTIAERRSIRQSQDRSRSESPIESCRCHTSRQKSGRKVTALKICDRCRTSPCRCRRNSASPEKKPPAKCYYCKISPCICSPVIEPANPRSFRKADSSHRRRKEFYNSTEEHVKANAKNVDNGYPGRENNRIVSCSGKQQPRKYCYRGDPTGQHTLNPEERVR